jgi:hypothetical protein
MLIPVLTIYYRGLCFNADKGKLSFVLIPTPMHAARSLWLPNWIAKFPPEAECELFPLAEADLKGLVANPNPNANQI